jgi:hypothetical protein
VATGQFAAQNSRGEAGSLEMGKDPAMRLGLGGTSVAEAGTDCKNYF